MTENDKNRSAADPSRRTFLKTAVTGLLVGVATQIVPGLSSASAAEKTSPDKKVLVVYTRAPATRGK